ncbi:MAG: hypothetical protein J6A14_01720 [Spirochaetaceae bacterium]|nr:hypothetical protein [Spirochaetaceae bacterium]
MVRTFCFSKNVVGQNWGVKEQADNLVRQLREALSGTDNFMVTNDVVMWKGRRIKVFFTENFGDTEKYTDLEETRFSEMSSIFLAKGFKQFDKKFFDETQILREGFTEKEIKSIGNSKPLFEWSEQEYNGLLERLKSL